MAADILAIPGAADPDPLKRLVLSIYFYLRSRSSKEVGVEALMRQAQMFADQLHKTTGRDDWDSVPTWSAARPARLDAAKRQENLGVPLRIVATLAEMKEPMLVEISAEGRGSITDSILELTGDEEPVPITEVATCARFVDIVGDWAWTLDIMGQVMIDKFLHLRRRGGYVEILAIPVALPISTDRKWRPDAALGGYRQGFFLHVVDIRPSTSLVDFLGASDGERKDIDRLLKDLRRAKISALDHIVSELETGLNIVGLDRFPLLEDIIEAVTLQSLSCGETNLAPSRLHEMIVGPPGQGKKLSGLAARILNPVSVEISPSKVSVAGLVGASHLSDDGWKSTPGALPLATEGVAVLQDAHTWEGSLVRKLATVLQAVIEDGEVHDTVAGGGNRIARTSLLIDMNRTSQVRTGGFASAGKEAALLQIRPLLSRFDTLIEIPEDAHRPWDIGLYMYDSIKPTTVGLFDQRWVRQLRLLVAALRDQIPTVDLDPVRELMRKAHNEIRSNNEKAIKDLPEAADLPVRMSISLQRFVMASARSRISDVAGPADVEVAKKFLNNKLEFLKLRGAAARPVLDGASGTTDRRAWLRPMAGQVVRTQELVDKYREDTGLGVHERTFRRLLQDLGALRETKGTYRLPPEDKWQ